jgi:hypothetical protein
VRKHFEQIGSIDEMSLPKGVKGGFGFVQYHKVLDAAQVCCAQPLTQRVVHLAKQRMHVY